jgi:hypothetical protein
MIKPKRSITVTAATGTNLEGYKVLRLVNSTTYYIGEVLSVEHVNSLIEKGWTVTIK